MLGAGAGAECLLAQAPRLRAAVAMATTAMILTNFTKYSPPFLAGCWRDFGSSQGTDNKNHATISTTVPSGTSA